MKERKKRKRGVDEACFDSRRGCGNDVNCFVFFVKIAGDGTRWKLEMEVGDRIYLTLWLVFFTFSRVGVELYAPDE